jgi:hypothetical protein
VGGKKKSRCCANENAKGNEKKQKNWILQNKNKK